MYESRSRSQVELEGSEVSFGSEDNSFCVQLVVRCLWDGD